MTDDRASISQLCASFANLAATSAARAPMYSGLSAAIGQRPEVAALLAAAPAPQRSPVLLMAAIHADVLAHPTCELAQWFPTATTDPRTDAIGPALERFVAARHDALIATVATRVTQTNEIGRCGLLVPPLGSLAAEVGPLALVDIGASAGLNLRLDHYRYRYEPGQEVGPTAPVTITVATRGSVPVPPGLPHITARIGLDQRPVDLADPAQTAWLRACVWPDQRDRFDRLDAALAIAGGVPAEVRPGDAVADLAATIDAVADHGHPVVINTWVLSYLTLAERQRYVATLRTLGSERDLSWVFAESPAQTPGLPHGGGHGASELTALGVVRWRAGREHAEHLATAHPHGYWLHWAS